ncbi:MAG TPA: hypothetical protein DCX46_07445 [Bacteroidetes bacterium]|nr:hypothetical protein [Bacteroidota bacterium]
MSGCFRDACRDSRCVCESMSRSLILVGVVCALTATTVCYAQDTALRQSSVSATPNTFTYPQSIFVDAASGHLWVADFENHRVLRFDVSALTSDVDPEPAPNPSSSALSQNYPNPFNPTTVIRYRVSSFHSPTTGSSDDRGGTHVRLRVYDILGREVAELVDRRQEAGEYAVTFVAQHLPAGIYLYSLRSAAGVEVRTMCLVK